MINHAKPSTLAGQTVTVSFANAPHSQLPDPSGSYDFTVEDYWDRVTGGSWMTADGNPSALAYAWRIGTAYGTPGAPVPDNEVLYGHIDHIGHLVHVSEVS